MTVVVFVSGHGFGHAVRAGEVVRAVAGQGVRVVIRSDAPAHAFGPLPATVSLESATVDVGVIQRGSMVIDPPATVVALERFWGELDRRVALESERIAAHGADVVVADIAPLGVLAARASGRPAVVIGNFTWDRIYHGLAAEVPALKRFADACAEVFRQADLTLVTAPDCGVTSGRRRLEVGSIVRSSRRPRAQIRQGLGLGPGQVGVQVAFGGLGAPPLPPPTDIDPGRVRLFGYESLGWSEELYLRVDRSEWEHPELVAAADLLLGKPGYGTVVECSAGRTPMLWLDRPGFAETPGLVRAIVDHVGGCELGVEELQAGRLGAAIDRALAVSPRRGPLAADGATESALRIRQMAGMAA